MNKDKKILIISPFFSPNTGGVETFLDDLIDYLNEKGEKVTVAAYQPITAKYKAPLIERKDGNSIFRLPWLKFNLFYKLEKYPLAQLAYLGTGLGVFSILYCLLKGKSHKTINCHGLAAGFIGFLLTYLVDKKFVLTIHTNYRFSKEKLIGKFVKKMAGRFDKILVLSNACMKNFLEIGVDEKKVKLYFNWVDEDLFVIKDKIDSRRKVDWQEDGFYALYVGRFSQEKGIFNIVDAAPKINGNINVAIIGGGEKEEKIRRVAGENKNMLFFGRKKPEELVDYFNAADILMFAPVDEDYFGRVAISALCCGLPVMVPSVSFYGGENTEVTMDIPASIGVKFEITTGGFAKKLNELFDNRKKLGFDRTECRRFAMQNYGREVNGEINYNALR